MTEGQTLLETPLRWNGDLGTRSMEKRETSTHQPYKKHLTNVFSGFIFSAACDSAIMGTGYFLEAGRRRTQEVQNMKRNSLVFFCVSLCCLFFVSATQNVTVYRLQMAASNNREAAEQKASEVQNAGACLPVTVEEVADNTAFPFKVRAGYYLTYDLAKAAETIHDASGFQCFVVTEVLSSDEAEGIAEEETKPAFGLSRQELAELGLPDELLADFSPVIEPTENHQPVLLNNTPDAPVSRIAYWGMNSPNIFIGSPLGSRLTRNRIRGKSTAASSIPSITKFCCTASVWLAKAETKKNKITKVYLFINILLYHICQMFFV